ncbi:uncharacterized protein FIBRA_01153 [Fibroporia radiculosa]|uniref:TOG domain-containing protein n=1 Tax=Fibroporia radiculosa TaxID=599839 RepID=J4G0U0_9APHY|nr:uncharacterized protein FIBRA_01153 [Fibroporia radiculosa]CCL99138.1 predicted protein [Fibroporia radiculosa]
MDDPPKEEDFNAIPVLDRLGHKNWKARVSAYETLVKTFQTTASDSDPAFKPYINNPDLLKKAVTDANAVAQEKGVECAIAFVKFAGENAARTREVIVPALVDKCFGSARAGTRTQAIELVLQFVEVENNGTGVVDGIIPGLVAKQPKVVAGCVTALKEMVRVFGTSVIQPAPVLKTLPKIFAHTDKNYIGSGIEPWLADLKPVQVKELKEAFEGMEKDGKGKGSVRPERTTRAAAREADSDAAMGDASESVAAVEEAPPDPRMFAEEVNIIAKLPQNLQSSLTSSKWKERKEVLDDLLTLLNATPRIKEAPELGDIAKSLATCVQKDANINCVMVAAGCIEALSKGMMTNFGRYREGVIPPMIERLKERKTNVTDIIGNALDAVFMTTTLPDVLSDILPALNSKNPQVKEGTLKFFARCLSSSTIAVPPQQMKSVSESLAALLEDSFEGARNEAANCLGTLMKMVGERPLNALMEGLADVRKAKVKEAYEKATIKVRAGAGAAPKAPLPATKEPPKKASTAVKKPEALKTASSVTAQIEEDLEVTESKPLKKPPARLLAKKAPTADASASSPGGSAPSTTVAPKKPPGPAGSKPVKATPPSQPGALDTFKFKHTPEDAEALAAEVIPGNYFTDLADSNWKTRLAALEEMTGWVEGAAPGLDAEVVVRFLGKKGWGEKNFQVSAKLYGILNILAEHCPSFGRSSVALCIPHLIEKLGDPKLKKPAGEVLLMFAEKTSLQFVLGHAYDPLLKQKAPKVLADAVTWLDQALTEFGIAGLSLRSLIEFLKGALRNSNAAVRTSATRTLVTVKLFAGSSIKDLLEDLNPQLLNTIYTEFDKVEATAAPEPSRTSADVAQVFVSAPGKGANGTSADALDDLFPRVELDGLLKGTTILTDAKSDAWKTKKEGLEALQSLLDQGANKRLKPTMGEIGQVLKARVTDTNKVVQALALDIVARVATGMGRPFEKYTRLYALPVATVLSDQKAPIRAAALQTLTAIANACEVVDSMVSGFATALESSNPLQRASLLNWLADWFKEHGTHTGLDISSWVGPVLACLDDRNGDVRKAAQMLLPTLVASAGYDYVMHQTSSLKSATKAAIVPIIQAARAATPGQVEPGPRDASTAPSKMPSAPKGTNSKGVAPPSPHSTDELLPEVASKAAPSKLAGVRRRLPQGTATARPESRSETPVEAGSSRLPSKLGTGLKRPGPVTGLAKVAQPSATPEPLPFVVGNMDAKRVRLSKDAQKWINEAGPTRKDLAELLQHQMEPHASKEVLALLFSHDHNAVNDHVSGLNVLHEFYSGVQASDGKPGYTLEELQAVGLANSDLALKYTSIKVHEPQSNLVQKCLEVVATVLAFFQSVDFQLTDAEALCFIPTVVYKLGDAREPVRTRVSHIVQSLSKVYAFSRVFQLLLEYGLKSKVAKTRQGTLDELVGLLKRFGIGSCEPAKAFPMVAAMISDKDPQVRKSALGVLSEGYILVGDSIWSYVGHLSPKDKTQLEERLRRVPGVGSPDKGDVAPVATHASRLAMGIPRSGSPAPGPTSRLGGIPRAGSPSVAGPSRIGRPVSPSPTVRPASPAPSHGARPTSPARTARVAGVSQLPGPSSPTGIGRPKSLLPSKLGPPRSRLNDLQHVHPIPLSSIADGTGPTLASHQVNGSDRFLIHPDAMEEPESSRAAGDITVVISSILSNDSSRSVDALKKIQKVLEVGPEVGPSSPAYQELAEHTEGLVETITLQMAHVFERLDEITIPENFRLAKHLIQTLNAFCDHVFLAESLTVDILTSLLEELTLRLLQTDNSSDNKVKDLSRFINMIILRLFATGRRMSIFRALFALLLQIVKPFPANGTSHESQEAKVAELILKCVWKLARNIPQDLENQLLDPVELFPAVEHFLQTVPPNEWRARATNKVPCGDMPLRTIKVIIQHVVAHHGDEVYDLLSASFDDPSATIVYPYVYRILNSSTRTAADVPVRGNGSAREEGTRQSSPAFSRPISPQGTSSSATSDRRPQSSSSHARSQSVSSTNGHGPGMSMPTEEPDPDDQLNVIIQHISSETTGAMHKEGITELHQYLKAYPHKKSKVDKMLESTGPAFRKYITRALASRAAEDEERTVAVANTLSKLESNGRERTTSFSPVVDTNHTVPISPTRGELSPRSPPRSSASDLPEGQQEKLSRLHDLFQYRSSIISNSSSHGRSTSSTLARAKSMKRKAIGFFASMMSSIPVVRAADDAKSGTGQISLSDDDACLVIGHGTKFLEEFSPKMQIMLPNSVNSAVAEVVEVLSDTQLRIKKEFGGDSGKGTARIREKLKELRSGGKSGLDFKKMPHVDQQEMYHYVYKCLTEAGCIGIFPEGGSHDRTDLLPLKAGVSLMALGAMANDPNVKVKIVPVGLSYFHPHRFRSRAVVEFGTALDVPEDLLQMFKEGGAQKRQAVGKLLDYIYDALKTVTIRAPDYDVLMLCQAARRLYKTPGQHLTLGQVVELNRRFLEGYLHFKDEPKVRKLRADVLKYNRMVRDLGLRDHQVPHAQKASWKTLGLLAYRLGLLIVWTILALPGVILNGPIFLAASIISRQKAKEALAASTVKLAGRDVLATWKILISLGFTPILCIFYAFLATVVSIRANVPLAWKIWTPILVILTLPFVGYAALKFGEAGMDVLKSLRPLVVTLAPGQSRSLDQLKAMRAKVSNELAEVINEFGPKLYDDFDQRRILVPSASVPPSSGQPGIWRRKSGTGGIDAQGNLLVHPMTWLDERLFGWSRSASRGTSAWSGSRSQDVSRAVTPEASDDEGDYDNVLGYLEGPSTSSRSRPRSQQSSYANLQKLRSGASSLPSLAMTSGAEATDTEGLQFRARTGSRSRRASLKDTVPVTRLSELDRQENFRDATENLNHEIEENRDHDDH